MLTRELQEPKRPRSDRGVSTLRGSFHERPDKIVTRHRIESLGSSLGAAGARGTARRSGTWARGRRSVLAAWLDGSPRLRQDHQMRVTYDSEVNAAYISLTTIGVGEARYQVPVSAEHAAGEIILDLDRDGRLIGIEVLDARQGLPEALIDGAEQ